jgi:hypothetical protein
VAYIFWACSAELAPINKRKMMVFFIALIFNC